MTLLAVADTANDTARPNLVLIIVCGVLVAAGIYLILERSLTRVLLGAVLASNGVSVLFLVVSGKARGAPIIGVNDPSNMSDPLPQAMVLTAIVITLATVGFVLALAYRQWQLTGADDVQDDVEDAKIHRLAERDSTSETYDPDVESTTQSDENATEDDEVGDHITDPDAHPDGTPVREEIADQSDPAEPPGGDT
ncbi:multisubunit sodium/proton antiporter MrpC subunit [Antricoccus suffuscus]|uniref:Multisubunit sodium/proton antiporter MrpC subunit n=1 Tax=Antricoccus suffuscus TaxID=1629062 RepID=A0A2T1A340_9ACTN|nr:Na(+)/H(+) antiporter subunit C [Antricoccus suffuscus]PRZ43020.1 multisubunit sodium/proton antiporter MrpC subunit [Antricoccus suffuscus]